MALYQPSNITPSTFAGIGGGVIDANDNVSISWQVNGTSAMTGFTVVVYRNNTSSTVVHTFTETLSTPFHGTDAQGNPVFFVYEPGETWAANGLSNGNGYKLKITQRWSENGTSKSVVQLSESVFIARAAPELTVSPASGTLSSVAQTFTGDYSQAQGDAVTWVRWVLTGADGTVLDDTGTVYTGVLSYAYDGFFNGETYTLSCTVETASGAEITAVRQYAVSYESAEQTGGITLECHEDDSVTVSWAAGADIPGVPSAEDYGSILDGVLHLAAERSITWDTVNGEGMAFENPYCFAWRGTIGRTNEVTSLEQSGTWTLDKEYTATSSTTDSGTTTASDWRQNPNVNTRVNGTLYPTIPITTASSQTRTTYVPDTMLDTIGSWDIYGNTYYYRTRTPASITFDIPVSSIDNIAVYYTNSAGGLVNDVGGIAVATRISNTQYEFTIYTTTSEALYSRVYARFIATFTLYTGTAYVDAPSGQTDIQYVSINGSPSMISASGRWTGTRFVIQGTSYYSGNHSVTLNYTYANSANNMYMATWTGTLPSSTGTLTSASIQSTVASGSATVSANSPSANQYTVTVYNANNTASVTTTVKLNYSYKTTGSDSYKSVVTGQKPGAISASVQSTTATRATVTLDAAGNYTVTMYYSSASPRSATIKFTVPEARVMSDLAVITDGETSASFSVGRSQSGYGAVLLVGGESVWIPVPVGAWSMLAVMRPGVFEVTWFTMAGALLGVDSATFSAAVPAPVSSVTAYGEQDCDFIYLSQNAGYDFSLNGYEPGWSGNTLLYAAFDHDLQGGTVTSADSMTVAIYRREGNTLSQVGVFGGDVQSVRDYAIRSGGEYAYEMFYVADRAYSAGAESVVMCRRFRQHTLIEAEEDAEKPGVYHPVNVWRFRDNLDAGAYTNQNQPVLLENFTKYPLWQPSSPAAKSGTLTALVGRFVNGVYTGETARDMEALFALSETVNPLFYRDMKGNLYMVRLSGPVTQTVNNLTAFMEVSVSVPWVEVGDAENVKIYTEE